MTISRVGDELHKARFLIVISYLSAIVFAGFWPYFKVLFQFSIPDVHWIIHIHAAIYVGWMVLLFTQARYIYSGNIGAHIKLGNFGIKYGYLVLAIGIIVAFAGPVINVSSGRMTLDQGGSFLLLTIGDMVLFGTLFLCAAHFRYKPEIHKRLMILATVALSFAAAARILPPEEYLVFLPFWLSPVFLAMALDRISNHKNERVYLLGIAFLFFIYLRVFILGTELWLPTGRWIMNIFV